ncbi:SH3 domain-containing protein [Candidatus Peregrinibacteria bacterium]|nr:SH3 domain-containing protein [Candidatus Peregrinibacteria bacterium]
MKKLVLLMMTVALLVVAAPSSMATDICSNDPLSSADFYVKTNSAVYLRDISCMDSNITATIPAGEVLHVIGKTEGWHKIERSDGSQGWLWESFLVATDETFDVTQPEPTPDPEVTYDPMYDIYDHKYEDAIWYVYDNGIVQGYEDGSYKPEQKINRAELLKIIVEAAYDESDFESYANESCFTDVEAGQWYTPYICFAKQEGIVEGYEDGTFRPAQEIIFVEALKITTVGFGNEYTKGTPWYKDTVDYASDMNVIPLDIDSFSEKLNRGQMAELITRILKYQESETAFEEYIGDSMYYVVTFETIDAGIDVEALVGTGACISDSTVYDDGESYDQDECTVCTCNNGNWLCTGLCM